MGNPESNYSFATKPVWLAGHVVVVVSVIVFVLLGLWQLQRDEERRTLDQQIAERLEAEPVALAELIAIYGEGSEDLALRRTLVEGTYLTSDEVIWQARTLRGVSGHDVLTPLQTEAKAVFIDRGWVPIDVTDPPVIGAEPPGDTVEVTGIILEPQTRGRFGPIDPDDAVLARISRVDTGRLQQQVEAPLYPFYIQLETQNPAQAEELPYPQATPTIGSGPPHFAYAVQWFVFAAVALVGYPILITRTARNASPRVSSTDTSPGVH